MDLTELQQIADRAGPGGSHCAFAAAPPPGRVSSGSLAVKEALDREVAAQGLSERVGGLQRRLPAALLRGAVGPGRSEPGIFREGQARAGPGARERPASPHAARVLMLTARKQGARRRAPFFAKQQSIVLENSGIIEPERIESYIAAGGYTALHHAIREMTPAQVVDTVTRSGLRGRGGAGYPTGVKWGLVAKMPGDKKFVVCNADEGDPGAFMDRSVLESDPHRVLEGMAIAAYAVGALARLHLRPRRISAGHSSPRSRHQAGPQARRCGHGAFRVAAQFPHRSAHRRRGVRVRRRDRADRIDRGQARACRKSARRIPRRKGCGIARR